MNGQFLHLVIGLLLIGGGAFILFLGEATSRRRENLTGDTARFAGVLLAVAGLAYLAVKLVFDLPIRLPW